jgi:hypothetical protein
MAWIVDRFKKFCKENDLDFVDAYSIIVKSVPDWSMWVWLENHEESEWKALIILETLSR